MSTLAWAVCIVISASTGAGGVLGLLVGSPGQGAYVGAGLGLCLCALAGFALWRWVRPTFTKPHR